MTHTWIRWAILHGSAGFFTRRWVEPNSLMETSWRPDSVAHITAGLVVEASEKDSGQHNNITGAGVSVYSNSTYTWLLGYNYDYYILYQIFYIHSISQHGGSIPVQSFPGFSRRFHLRCAQVLNEVGAARSQIWNFPQLVLPVHNSKLQTQIDTGHPTIFSLPFFKATQHATRRCSGGCCRGISSRRLKPMRGGPFRARDAVWHRKTWEKHITIVVKCCEMLWNIVKICEMMWKRLNWKVRKVRTVGKWQQLSTGKLGHEANMIMTPVGRLQIWLVLFAYWSYWRVSVSTSLLSELELSYPLVIISMAYCTFHISHLSMIFPANDFSPWRLAFLGVPSQIFSETPRVDLQVPKKHIDFDPPGCSTVPLGDQCLWPGGALTALTRGFLSCDELCLECFWDWTNKSGRINQQEWGHHEDTTMGT